MRPLRTCRPSRISSSTELRLRSKTRFAVSKVIGTQLVTKMISIADWPLVWFFFPSQVGVLIRRLTVFALHNTPVCSRCEGKSCFAYTYCSCIDRIGDKAVFLLRYTGMPAQKHHPRKINTRAFSLNLTLNYNLKLEP